MNNFVSFQLPSIRHFGDMPLKGKQHTFLFTLAIVPFVEHSDFIKQLFYRVVSNWIRFRLVNGFFFHHTKSCFMYIPLFDVEET